MKKFILFVALAIVATVTLPMIYAVIMPVVNALLQFANLLSNL